MIVQLVMYMFIQVMTFMTGFLPGGGETAITLPWGLDDLVQQGAAGYHVLAQSFPPFTVVLQAFLIYFLFKIAMMILKAVPILGRTIR